MLASWPLAALLEEAPAIFPPHSAGAGCLLPPSQEPAGRHQAAFPRRRRLPLTPLGFHTRTLFSGACLCRQGLVGLASLCAGAVLPCTLLPHVLGGQWLLEGELALSCLTCLGSTAGSVLRTALSMWAVRSALPAAALKQPLCISWGGRCQLRSELQPVGQPEAWSWGRDQAAQASWD